MASHNSLGLIGEQQAIQFLKDLGYTILETNYRYGRLEADILGAMAQGMHAVHFNSHEEERHDKCLIVDSLDELNTFF